MHTLPPLGQQAGTPNLVKSLLIYYPLPPSRSHPIPPTLPTSVVSSNSSFNCGRFPLITLLPWGFTFCHWGEEEEERKQREKGGREGGRERAKARGFAGCHCRCLSGEAPGRKRERGKREEKFLLSGTARTVFNSLPRLTVSNRKGERELHQRIFYL